MQDGEILFDAEDSLTNMLLQKEKELQDLSKMRISQLQDQLLFKEKNIFDLECQVRRLSEDSSYKANLISQRDAEIADLESTISQLSQENLSISPMVSSLNSEIIILQEKIESLEHMNISLRESQENFSDLSGKLQESYSLNNKLKHDLQLQNERLRNIERLYEDILNENKQKSEEINSKSLHIQHLSADKEKSESELKDLKNKFKLEKDRMEREVSQVQDKLLNEIHQIKIQKENSAEQTAFNSKIQYDKFQSQIKALLEDNKKLNQMLEYYQNQVIEKEKVLNQEIYALRKESMENKQKIEEINSCCRSKDIEIASIKDLVDHWKNLAATRAEELFKMKQLQLRSEEKAEGYLKELDQAKVVGFDEVQRLKRDVESLLKEKRTRVEQDGSESGLVLRLRSEVDRLNEILYVKEQENVEVCKGFEDKERVKTKKQLSVNAGKARNSSREMSGLLKFKHKFGLFS